jgi:hypothetical protein
MKHPTSEPDRRVDGEPVAPGEVYVPDDYDDRPTAKQLSYLRTLADRAGQTFAYPRTISQASREIRRLLKQEPSSRVERRVERKQIADQISQGPKTPARVDLDRETTGYGSNATWKERA